MVTAITGAVALVSVLLAVVALRAARLARAAAEAAQAATRVAEARIAELAAEPPRRTDVEPEQEPSFVITGIGTEEPRTVAAQHVDGRLFADIVARESVIRAAGLAHGLRRALGAETRNRIRFEVRREVKRARRQRRTDLKAAMRDVQARQRADLTGEGDAA
jgi:hypothetical protein